MRCHHIWMCMRHNESSCVIKTTWRRKKNNADIWRRKIEIFSKLTKLYVVIYMHISSQRKFCVDNANFASVARRLHTTTKKNASSKKTVVIQRCDTTYAVVRCFASLCAVKICVVMWRHTSLLVHRVKSYDAIYTTYDVMWTLHMTSYALQIRPTYVRVTELRINGDSSQTRNRLCW